MRKSGKVIPDFPWVPKSRQFKIFTLYALIIMISGLSITIEAQTSNLTPVEFNSDQLVRMAVMGQIGEARMGFVMLTPR